MEAKISFIVDKPSTIFQKAKNNITTIYKILTAKYPKTFNTKYGQLIVTTKTEYLLAIEDKVV